jgi:hypothetical protein
LADIHRDPARPISLSDGQLRAVMIAARPLPPDKRVVAVGEDRGEAEAAWPGIHDCIRNDWVDSRAGGLNLSIVTLGVT